MRLMIYNFLSQLPLRTFDGKKPYGFLKSIITYALRPKVTYAGKQIRLKKETMNESITIVRSEQLDGISD